MWLVGNDGKKNCKTNENADVSQQEREEIPNVI
jgi:hypothetical protein